jgi:exonuclease VII small subunit
MSTKKKNINLEKSLTDLEALVEELESGDLKSAGGDELEEFEVEDDD